jgi:hypothetical protein
MVVVVKAAPVVEVEVDNFVLFVSMVPEMAEEEEEEVPKAD